MKLLRARALTNQVIPISLHGSPSEVKLCLKNFLASVARLGTKARRNAQTKILGRCSTRHARACTRKVELSSRSATEANPSTLRRIEEESRMPQNVYAGTRSGAGSYGRVPFYQPAGRWRRQNRRLGLGVWKQSKGIFGTFFRENVMSELRSCLWCTERKRGGRGGEGGEERGKREEGEREGGDGGYQQSVMKHCRFFPLKRSILKICRIDSIGTER